MNPVRLYSLENGKKPISLVHGQVAMNNADGILFMSAKDGRIIELRERNKFYDVANLQERNDLALNSTMQNGDYVRYVDGGIRYMEVYFDFKWFVMYKVVI